MLPAEPFDLEGPQARVEREGCGCVCEVPLGPRPGDREEPLLVRISQGLTDRRLCVPQGSIVLLQPVPEACVSQHLAW